MPKIKTRKAIQEGVRQVKRIKQTPRDETSPESRAAGNVETTVKYTAQDTARILRQQVKKRIHNAKKPKTKRAKQSIKPAQRAIQVYKAIGKTVVTGIKAMAAAGKVLASAIASGGWIAVVIFLVVCLVVFFGAFLLAEESGTGLQAVALSQVGNVGGEPYWSWYSYTSRVEWCACFVSWCGEQCGYLETEIMPKYANCADGVSWFQEHEQWLDSRQEPSPGMIIFFDHRGQDGVADHTGIVIEVKNGTIKTVEGNSNDCVEINRYFVEDAEILGYGFLLHIKQKDAVP